MANDDKRRADTQRALRAKQLLEDELINEGFANLEAAYVKAWRDTLIGDVNAREKLFLAINVVGKVKEHLNTIIANGALAQKELDDMAKLAEHRKRFGLV